MGQGESERSFTVMPPVEFNKMVLPTFMNEIPGVIDANLPLCPMEYNE